MFRFPFCCNYHYYYYYCYYYYYYYFQFMFNRPSLLQLLQFATVSLKQNVFSYRISSNRSPRPLLIQLRQTPGLYSRSGLYSRPGLYQYIHITTN